MAGYDVTDFQMEVLERSKEVPVLVDFWAEWCGPCRVLGPVLERMAQHAGGRWELKKVNTEQFPEVSAQYGIRSIPNVKLFSGGHPIDEFVGALPEPAIQQWLDKALPDPNSDLLDHAEALLRSGHADAAAEQAQKVLSIMPGHLRARTLTALALLFKESSKAYELVKDFDEGSEQWELAGSVQEIARILARAKDPGSFEEKPVRSQYLKAISFLAEEKFDEALSAFIDVIREDRYYDDDGSRKICIAIFKYLGEEHEITLKHRRDFGSALYV